VSVSKMTGAQTKRPVWVFTAQNPLFFVWSKFIIVTEQN